jgi:RecA/RadA recombinase
MIETGTVIDRLGGGLWPGEVTLFYGNYASGKTLTALAICVQLSNRLKKKAVYINTETGESDCGLSKKIASNFGDISNVVFIAARTKAALNNLLGGKSREDDEGEEKIEKLAKFVKDPCIVVVDSVTWHYAGEVKRARPEYKSRITQEFQGKVEMWSRYLFQFGCPIIYIAQAKSQVGKMLKQKQEQEQEQGQELECEWIGGNALGFISKEIYKFTGLANRRIKITKFRGEGQGKEIIVDLSDLTNLLLK